MLATPLTRLLKVDHPIIQSGMADAGWLIASEVSNAGALGGIGSIGRSVDAFREEIRLCREKTDRPFSVNVVTFAWAPHADALVDVAIEERVPAIVLSFGDFGAALRRCRAAGLTTLVQVQDVAGAQAALDGHADGIIVQGNEAGGHTGGRGTLSFAAQVLDMAGDTPVALAGGIANGRGLAAALAMGAGGVMMGTRFKATPEFGPSQRFGDAQKAAIVASDGSNTVRDPIVDMPLSMEWPKGVIGRVIGNQHTSEWLGRDRELAKAITEAGAPRAFARELNGSPETVLNWAGEASALVHGVVPAAQVVRETMSEAEALLGAVAGLLASQGSERSPIRSLD